MKQWLQEIDRYACESVSKLLVGNKCDLDAEGKRSVSYDTAKDLADSLGLTLIETSAKDSTNVEKCFMKMATEIQKTFVFFFCFVFFFLFCFFKFFFSYFFSYSQKILKVSFLMLFIFFRLSDSSPDDDGETLIDFSKPPQSSGKNCRC